MIAYEATYSTPQILQEFIVYVDDQDLNIDILSQVSLSDNFIPFIDSVVVRAEDLGTGGCDTTPCDIGEGECVDDDGCMTGLIC